MNNWIHQMIMSNNARPSPSTMRSDVSLDYEFFNYLVEQQTQPGDRIPALGDLSTELNLSVSKLREQLEVARSLGLVSVRPRTGIHRRAFDFMPAVRLSLFFAVANDVRQFDSYSELRKHVETAFWHQAVDALTDDDKHQLRKLVGAAWEKLRGNPIRIPHTEHRQFHLTIFARLDNPFVRGILEAYWEAYEAVQLNTYADYDYLNEVWSYHDRIAQAISAGNVEESLEIFEEHTRLLPVFADGRD
jgi:DNA-binding FadR family transcriptional regulator